MHILRSEVKCKRKVDTKFSIDIKTTHIKVCLRGQYLDARGKVFACLPRRQSNLTGRYITGYAGVFLLRTQQLMIKIRTLELILDHVAISFT